MQCVRAHLQDVFTAGTQFRSASAPSHTLHQATTVNCFHADLFVVRAIFASPSLLKSLFCVLVNKTATRDINVLELMVQTTVLILQGYSALKSSFSGLAGKM